MKGLPVLQKVEIEGFKTLRQRTEIPLEPITLLVGANNSGKSNILSGVQLLGETVRARRLAEAIRLFGGRDIVAPRTTPEAPLALTASGRIDGTSFRYSLATPSPDRPKGSESLQIGDFSTATDLNGNWNHGGGTLYGLEPGAMLDALVLGGRPGVPPEVQSLHKCLRGIEVFSFSPSALRKPAEVSTATWLHPDGEGLAAVLDQLDSQAPDVRERINEEVRAAAPEIRRVVTPTKEPGYKVVGFVEGSGKVYEASQASDGLLLFVAIATAAHRAGSGTLIGLEEIETGIHPRRLRAVLDLLIRLSNAGSQFLLTTHSPVLLNEFRDFPERVLICERSGEDTRVHRLLDTPNYEEAISNEALGDIWYSGALGGVPHP